MENSENMKTENKQKLYSSTLANFLIKVKCKWHE